MQPIRCRRASASSHAFSSVTGAPYTLPSWILPWLPGAPPPPVHALRPFVHTLPVCLLSPLLLTHYQLVDQPQVSQLLLAQHVEELTADLHSQAR